MKKFDIPIYYRSPIVTKIKKNRSSEDRLKKDLTPTELEFSNLKIKIARHFGFCFGVENAIEIAYRAVDENPGKRVFLLSEMIHNPRVNGDLIERGVKFLQTTEGKELIPFSELTSDDVVIVPAFGTTVEMFKKLADKGIDAKTYNTTCPFVERVWKKASDLGKKGFTIIIHGKHDHEETRATFSHAKVNGPGIIIKDMAEALELNEFLSGKKSISGFMDRFGKLCSEGFDPKKDLKRVGVVNQTTMLATETQAIAKLVKEAIKERVGEEKITEHFADTRDTLCYATTENQNAVYELLKSGGDLALVVGGYNSSNTSHLVEICEEKLPTFYIKDASEIKSREKIRHLDLMSNKEIESSNWFPKKEKVTVLLTAGASCPDALVDEVIERVKSIVI